MNKFLGRAFVFLLGILIGVVMYVLETVGEPLYTPLRRVSQELTECIQVEKRGMQLKRQAPVPVDIGLPTLKEWLEIVEQPDKKEGLIKD